ncbi:S-adenosylmethionine:tRNA ribosyltransferase-isomerase, partial [Desulfovibrio sp. OttesenSCG-928-C14]|nr:S-adenosylmethionine:tRNA ribosyltransferase-isomerase [Desulfovibrio sp. OttesenSCG-928-C14]
MNKNSDSYPDLKKNAQTGEKPASGANFLDPEPDLPEDYLLSSYNFDLPEAQIAQHPPERRGQSRLYLLDRNRPKGPEGPKDPGGPEGSGEADGDEAADLAGRDLIRDFSALPELLPPRSLLVANNSMVAPA